MWTSISWRSRTHSPLPAPGTLLVLAAGDAFGELPGADYPHQHMAA